MFFGLVPFVAPGALCCAWRGPEKGKLQVTLTFHRDVILLGCKKTTGPVKMEADLGQGRSWPRT